jgi:hypothetical protein
MSLSRINISAVALTAAASKLPSLRWQRICASPNSARCATHTIRKRCFGSRCQKAAPDHSPTALQVKRSSKATM